VALAASLAGTGAGPALAQDVKFTIAPTEQCLADGGWRECIGTAAEACMAIEPGAWSTPRTNFCLDAERAWWDAELNAAYGQLIAAERAADADPAHAGRPSAEEAARAMQRAWIVWRDATCNHEVLDWWGGTGANAAWLGCLMRMTGEQALYLRSTLAAG
jgi:uncharacterized protein YecT (DUF1311 family)